MTNPLKHLKPSSVTKHTALCTVILFLLISSWAIVQYGKSLTPPATISFHGTGEVIVQNDIAEIYVTFSALENDVVVARNEVREQTNTLHTSLQKHSIPERDIKTTSYAVHPEYTYHPPSPTQPGERKLDGYRVSHTTEIRIRDIDKTGDILDDITDLKPEHIGDLRFTIDPEERTKLEEEATVLAIQDARAQAKRISRKSKLHLDRVIGVNIHNERSHNDRYYSARSFASAESIELKTPISTGEDLLQKTVTITYALH